MCVLNATALYRELQGPNLADAHKSQISGGTYASNEYRFWRSHIQDVAVEIETSRRKCESAVIICRL